MIQEFLTRPIKVISAYMGHKVVVFKNAVAIRVNRELKRLKEFTYI